MKSLSVIIAFSLVIPLAAGQVIQVIGDFEADTAGTAAPPCGSGATAEFFCGIYAAGTSPGATHSVICPDGVSQLGPCAGMPSSGNNWLEVAPALADWSLTPPVFLQGLGPAQPVIPPSTPALSVNGLSPFAPGSVAEVEVALLVPNPPSGAMVLQLEWYWFSGETVNGSAASGGGYDDFAQVTLVDPTGLNPDLVALYVDTWPANQASPNAACISAVTATAHPNVYNPQGQPSAQTATVTIPPAFFGQPAFLRLVAANQFDNAFSSVLWVDNIRFVDPGQLFTFVASTTGGGVGDLNLGVANVPAAANNCQVLLSSTPAIAGLGSGFAFGLVPDGLFYATLFSIPGPGNLLHFPAAANPYAPLPNGLLVLPPGSATFLGGQTWEGVAVAYSLATGMVQASNFQQLGW